MNFANNLRNLRIQRGLSQLALANDMKMSQARIAAYEVGRNEPSFDVVQQFADYFHVSPLTLLPFGDVFQADEREMIAEQIQGSSKLMDLFDIVKNFGASDLDALIAVAKSLRAKYGD